MQQLLLWNNTNYAATLSNTFGKENIITNGADLALALQQPEKCSSLIVLCELNWAMKGETTNRQQLIGLILSVYFRLQNSASKIFLLSFLSKEELKQHDSFGILSLSSTEFIRLPFSGHELFSAIDNCVESEVTIPNQEWEFFAVKASKTLLQQKISILKHDGKLAYGNQVINPLRVACISAAEYPECLDIAKKHLQSLQYFTEQEEITELFSLANTTQHFQDNYLQQIFSFTSRLKQLTFYANKEELNIPKLICDIDKLNETFKTILNN